MLHNLPGSPKESLVTYVEYAAKFPTLNEHLQLASARMDLITYLCLDVIACVVVTVVVCVCTFLFSLRFAVRYVSRSGYVAQIRKVSEALACRTDLLRTVASTGRSTIRDGPSTAVLYARNWTAARTILPPILRHHFLVLSRKGLKEPEEFFDLLDVRVDGLVTENNFLTHGMTSNTTFFDANTSARDDDRHKS